MRHKVATMKLARDKDHRRAMMRNLAAGLFISGRIRTTIQKARFVRSFVEKIITTAREDTEAARRLVAMVLPDRYIVNKEETDVKRTKSLKIVKGPRLLAKIFGEIGPKYADRGGGYTRIIHLSDRRIGDNSRLVYLELIDPAQEKTTKKSRTGGNRRKKAQTRLALMTRLLKGEKKADKSAEAPAAAETPAEAPAEEKKE
jgi:large subunit ribosomal protein L17